MGIIQHLGQKDRYFLHCLPVHLPACIHTCIHGVFNGDESIVSYRLNLMLPVLLPTCNKCLLLELLVNI